MTESLRERCSEAGALAIVDVQEESDQELIQATYPLNHGETFRKKLWTVLRGNGE